MENTSGFKSLQVVGHCITIIKSTFQSFYWQWPIFTTVLWQSTLVPMVKQMKVFKNSNIGQTSLWTTETDGPSLPYVLVGDAAFQMFTNLMKPYSSRGLTHTKRIFNYRLTRA